MRAREVFLLAALCLVTAGAFADGGFVLPKPPTAQELKEGIKAAYLDEPEQQAIIVFDGSEETLYLQARYEGNIEDFAWIIPTPAKPVVGKGTSGLFEDVAEYFYRLKLEEWKAGRLPIAEGGVISFGDEGGKKEKASKPEKVKVVEFRRVGVFDLTVLEATDSDALVKWLEKNEYGLPETEETKSILSHYVKQEMYFCALRVNKGSRKASARTLKGWINPVTISFATERPFYPLRISALHTRREAGSDILIHLFSRPDRLSLTGVKRLARNFSQHEYGFEWKDLPKCFRAFQDLTRRKYILTTFEGFTGLDDMYDDLWFATREDELEGPEAARLWARARKSVSARAAHGLCRDILARYPCTSEAADAYKKLQKFGERLKSLDESDAQARTADGHSLVVKSKYVEAVEKFREIARLYPWHAAEAEKNLERALDYEKAHLAEMWNSIQEQRQGGAKTKDYTEYYKSLVALMLLCSDLHDDQSIYAESLKEKYYAAGLKEVEWVNKTYAPLMDRKFDVTWKEIEWQAKRDPALSMIMCRKIIAVHPGTRYADKARDYIKKLGE